MTELGNFIRERRALLRMSLQDVGEIAKITKAHVCGLENGKSCNPTIKTILGLAEALQENPIKLAALSIADQPGVVTECIGHTGSRTMTTETAATNLLTVATLDTMLIAAIPADQDIEAAIKGPK